MQAYIFIEQKCRQVVEKGQNHFMKVFLLLVVVVVFAYCINPIQGNLEAPLVEWCGRRRRSALRIGLVRWHPTPPPGAQCGFRTDALPTELRSVMIWRFFFSFVLLLFFPCVPTKLTNILLFFRSYPQLKYEISIWQYNLTVLEFLQA